MKMKILPPIGERSDVHHLVEHRASTRVLEPRDDVDNPVNIKQLLFF